IKKGIADAVRISRRISNAQAAPKDTFRILLYHAVGAAEQDDRLGLRIAPEVFARQMSCIREEGYHVYPLTTLLEALAGKKELPAKAIALTFDDGYRENLEFVLAQLRQYAYKAIFFVTAGSIGRSPLATKERYWERWKLVDAVDLKMIADEGHGIGSHTLTHCDLRTLPPDRLKNELSCSRKILEDTVRAPIEVLSYPHGRFNASIMRAAADAGYRGACCSLYGRNGFSTAPLALRRTTISAGDGIDEFRKKLEGCYDWMGIKALWTR
ncbi:MAG: polysaccharide deacetylase family protein, partial [Candidatus Omnitrophota bacterium]